MGHLEMYWLRYVIRYVTVCYSIYYVMLFDMLRYVIRYVTVCYSIYYLLGIVQYGNGLKMRYVKKIVPLQVSIIIYIYIFA